RSRDFAYFDPSKYVAEGRKGALSRKHIQLTSQNRCVTRSVKNCIPTPSEGTLVKTRRLTRVGFWHFCNE
ncbi:hypothetical protein, partial [Pseudomonas syringae group genomosp. 3]|uniref:hypothetical protein n=2 Tax=Pseudomonas syringae group genomosp. 3 TaxID=251701 RepID=UPI001C8199D3